MATEQVYTSHHFHQPLHCTAPNCTRTIPVAVCISDDYPENCIVPAIWRCAQHGLTLDPTPPTEP